MTVELIEGDCREVLRELADSSIESCVTDPPYHLTSIAKRYGNTSLDGTGTNERRAKARSDQLARLSRGFMGKKWDGGDVAFKLEVWQEVLRVLKPGGHLVAFGGTRTYHRLACAIEDAGFEIRDQIGWLYGSGFPKSHNQHDEWDGWGTALKPAWEPIVLARKPLDGTVAQNLETHRTGAINIDNCRVPSGGGRERAGEASQDRRYTNSGATNFAALPGPRGGDPDGRWPANIIHDGSDEVLDAFPNARGQLARSSSSRERRANQNVYGAMNRGGEIERETRATREVLLRDSSIVPRPRVPIATTASPLSMKSRYFGPPERRTPAVSSLRARRRRHKIRTRPSNRPS